MHMFLRHLTVQAADPNLHRCDEGTQKKEGSIWSEDQKMGSSSSREVWQQWPSKQNVKAALTARGWGARNKGPAGQVGAG